MHSHNSHTTSAISEPPTPPPESSEPPTPPPPEPSDPSDDGSGYNHSGVFDIRNFGAIGDGETDDTDAFKMAWDAACQANSAVILVPYGQFMIQSTIFTGPCQGGLVLQVMYLKLCQSCEVVS